MRADGQLEASPAATPQADAGAPGRGAEAAAGPLLSRVFEALDAGAFSYCVLHGYEGFPNLVPSDVDCVMSAHDLTRLAGLLHGGRAGTGAELVQWIPDSAHYVVLAGPAGEAGATAVLPLHVGTDFEVDRRVVLPGREFLDRSVPHRGFRVPPPDLEFAGVLVNKVAKGRLSREDVARLRALFARDPAGCRRRVARLWSGRTAGRVLRATESGEWDRLRRGSRWLRAELLARATARRPLETARRWAAGQLRRADRWWRPGHGLHVVFLGPDGVGKSTVIEAVRGQLGRAFLGAEYFTFAPGLLPRRARGAGGAGGPHGKPPRSRAASLAKAAWWLACYTAGYALTVRPALARSRLVINHRYLLDAIVDPKRYRYQGPAWLIRLIWRVSPKPDLVILLDAPAGLIRARKPELGLAEIERQRVAYRGLVGGLPYGSVVDASRPVDRVVDDVSRIIIRHLAARVARRLGLPEAPSETPRPAGSALEREARPSTSR